MKYKINIESLFSDKRKNKIEAINEQRKQIRALYYFFEVGKFAINEELYNKLDSEGKRYFMGVKETNP